MNFSSTLLAQTNDPKEIQKADLDLLAKVNQVAAALPTTSTGTVTTYASWASVVAYAAPLPQTAAGGGQVVGQLFVSGGAWVLPAGGTWEYWGFTIIAGTGVLTGASYYGVAAGGTTIVAAVAGVGYIGRQWRIA